MVNLRPRDGRPPQRPTPGSAPVIPMLISHAYERENIFGSGDCAQTGQCNKETVRANDLPLQLIMRWNGRHSGQHYHHNSADRVGRAVTAVISCLTL